MLTSTMLIDVINKMEENMTPQEFTNALSKLSGTTAMVFTVFLTNPETVFSTNEMKQKSGISYSATFRAIRRLKDMGLIMSLGFIETKRRRNKWGVIPKGGPRPIGYILEPEVAP